MKSLLPHQIEDAAFLASKSFAGNFSKMRTGKTMTALEAVRLVQPPNGIDQIIIVGPPISLTMWAEEFEAFFPGLKAQVIRTGKAKLKAVASAYIMSYDIATKRLAELKDLKAKVLICDESHALKNPKAKRTHALIGSGGLCESVDHAWMLTGTPSTKYNDDMFTFLCRAGGSALEEKIGKISLERFQLRYCITQRKKFSPKQRYLTTVTVGNRNTTELNEMIYGGMAVRRESVEGMPQLTTSRLTIPLDKSGATQEVLDMLKEIEGKSISAIQKAIQADDPGIATLRRFLGIGKVKASVDEIKTRIEDGNGPILVGAWHHDVIDAAKEALKGLRVAVIDGRVNPKKRDQYQEMFNTGQLDVLIGQIGSMGVAIDLSAGGGHIVIIEEDWSPAIMEQFYFRMMNFGETRHDVHADIFQSDTKLDEAVARISANKTRGHKQLLDQDHGV